MKNKFLVCLSELLPKNGNLQSAPLKRKLLSTCIQNILKGSNIILSNLPENFKMGRCFSLSKS